MAQGDVILSDDSVRNRHINSGADIEHSKMAQRVLAKESVPLTQLRVWDALHTNLPGTAASDDLALITGTWGTDAPTVRTSDAKATTVTQRAAFFIPIPADFDEAEPGTVKIRVCAGMKTTVSDTTATVDVEAWRIDKDGTLGSADLVSTAAQSINSLTLADKDFTVTSSTLLAGDMLYVRVTIAITDGATGTAVIGQIAAIDLLADLR